MKSPSYHSHEKQRTFHQNESLDCRDFVYEYITLKFAYPIFIQMKDLWKVYDKSFRKFLEAKEINAAVNHLARRIDEDYAGKKPIFLIILNGAFIFASDLIKQTHIDCEIAFVRLKSYDGTQSSGIVNEMMGVDIELSGRHVIVVEDIIDTGLTLDGFLAKLQHLNPASIRVAACLLKPAAFKMSFPIDYLCFSIPNEFVVGYGLDYNGLGRNSEDIYILHSTNE